MFASIALILITIATGEPRGEGIRGQDFDTFETTRLRCVIGNNTSTGDHRPGYNGVFSIWSPDQEVSPFVPAYAGLNLEHYFDTGPRAEDSAIFFEPRHAAMDFVRLGKTSAELRQPATPRFAVESTTRFELKPPYYIDMTYTATPTKDVFEGGTFGAFWASYIHGPLDKSIYFLREGSSLDAPIWAQYCTQQHGLNSTVLGPGHRDDDFPATSDGTLFRSFSPLRYAASFYYGRVRNMVLIYIFRPNPHLRFSHSPSGGGSNAAGDDTNPAWDFQLVVSEYNVGAEYRLELRAVYKTWAGREDVLREVRRYLDDED